MMDCIEPQEKHITFNISNYYFLKYEMCLNGDQFSKNNHIIMQVALMGFRLYNQVMDMSCSLIKS